MDIAFGPHTGSYRCTSVQRVYNIEDISNLILIDEYERCAYQSYPSYIIVAANTRVSPQNIFWIYSRGPASVIWNSSNGIGIPPPDSVNRNIFPPGMLSAGGYYINEFPNVIPIDDKVIITTFDKVYSYNPLIVDTTPEVIELSIEGISGGSILDGNQLYVPTNQMYQVIDYSDSNHPILITSLLKPDFTPKYIQNGVALGISEIFVYLIQLSGSINNRIDVKPVELDLQSLTNSYIETVELQKYPSDIFINDVAYHYFQKMIEFEGYSISISQSYVSSFGEIPRYIFIEDMRNSKVIDAFKIGRDAVPSIEISGNILSIPAGDSGTFHFLLDDALLGTVVDEWLEY